MTLQINMFIASDENDFELQPHTVTHTASSGASPGGVLGVLESSRILAITYWMVKRAVEAGHQQGWQPSSFLSRHLLMPLQVSHQVHYSKVVISTQDWIYWNLILEGKLEASNLNKRLSMTCIAVKNSSILVSLCSFVIEEMVPVGFVVPLSGYKDLCHT